MPDIKNVLRRVYVMTVPVPPAASFKVNKTSIRSFYRKVDHGPKKQFKTGLMMKGMVLGQLSSGSA
eukprot:4233766-Alexandrium_andersonii.AAC.1